ncbi:MAG TPA: VWA domain-containing protein [Bryobacteraceae bacterium]|nr:VWA domain-containing protein [Bryobacteraceae bacterium]
MGQDPKPKDDQDFTIRTTSRLVLLDVSVKDSAGGFVSGLTKDNFKVYEEGKPQQITQFGGADQPVTVGIVVDESGSMGPKRAEVIGAALEFIRASNPHDEVFVVNFNEKARRGLPDAVPFTDDIKELGKALWRGLPEGRTALYDAVELALRQLQMGRRDRKAMVLISDGGDNVSTHKWPEVNRDVLESLVTIYTIGIFDEDDTEKDPKVLERLAHASGGAVYFPKTLPEVIPTCKQIAKDIRERYTIGYIPNTEGKPVRHVKVEAFADQKKLVTRTRSSYLFEAATEAANRK